MKRIDKEKKWEKHRVKGIGTRKGRKERKKKTEKLKRIVKEKKWEKRTEKKKNRERT